MNKELLRVRLYELIKSNPGITKNEMLDKVKDEFDGANFSHVYLIVKKFIEDRIVKVDGRKKNTGHYMPDVDIPEDIPTTSQTSKQNGEKQEYIRPNKQPEKRFVLEKNESNVWRTVDENDISDPIENLFNQCVKLVPLHYRVRDVETDTILHERQPQYHITGILAEASA